MIERSRRALAREIIADLPEKIDLVYVEQGDKLTDEQVALVVKGDNLFEDPHLDEWESDNRRRGEDYEIKERVSNVIHAWERDDGADYSSIADAFEASDEEDEVREAINERESGDWVRDLINGCDKVLLRITCIDEDNAYSFEVVTAQQVLDKVGFEATEANVKAVQYALDNASPEYSVTMGYWIVGADVGHLYDLPAEPEAEVDIVNPHLYLGSPFMGSGFVTEEPLTGVARVKRSELRTDKDQFGYSINDIYGGVYASSFEADIRPVMRRCLREWHTGTVSDVFHVGPDGRTGWTGYHGALTANVGRICDECIRDWRENYPGYDLPVITPEKAAEIDAAATEHMEN